MNTATTSPIDNLLRAIAELGSGIMWLGLSVAIAALIIAVATRHTSGQLHYGALKVTAYALIPVVAGWLISTAATPTA